MKKQELFGIGTRVIITRTRDVGTIIEKLGDDLVLVKLENSNDAIPVFEEFLQRYSVLNAEPINKTIEHPKIEKLNVHRSSQITVSDTGVHLIFESVENADGMRAFDVYFFNDTRTLHIINPLIWVKNNLLEEETSAISISSGAIEFMRTIALNTLNDSPEIELEIQKFATDGATETLHTLLKLKTKMFVKNNALHPITREGIVLLKINTEEDKTTSTLKKYTQQVVKSQSEIKKQKEKQNQLIDWRSNLNAYAHFKNELDLHIQQLHADHKSLSPAESLQIQLQAFENYLQRAINVGIPSVFIIHGLGTGRLRDRIAARLRRSENVLHFKNEFHEKYGFGATEVIFK